MSDGTLARTIRLDAVEYAKWLKMVLNIRLETEYGCDHANREWICVDEISVQTYITKEG